MTEGCSLHPERRSHSDPGNPMKRTLTVLIAGISFLLGALAVQAQQIKVMEYDASQDIGANTNPSPQSAAYARVIAYQQPDIVCFSELNDGSSAAAVGAG